MRQNLSIKYPNAPQYSVVAGAGDTLVFCRQPKPGDVLQNIADATLEYQPDLLSAPVGSPCVIRRLLSETSKSNTTISLGFTETDGKPVFIPNQDNYCPICPSIEDCHYSYEELRFRHTFPQIAEARVLKHPFERILLALYNQLGNQLNSDAIAAETSSSATAIRKILSREPFQQANCIEKHRGNHGGYRMPAEPLTECVGCAVRHLCVFPDYLKSLKM